MPRTKAGLRLRSCLQKEPPVGVDAASLNTRGYRLLAQTGIGYSALNAQLAFFARRSEVGMTIWSRKYDKSQVSETKYRHRIEVHKLLKRRTELPVSQSPFCLEFDRDFLQSFQGTSPRAQRDRRKHARYGTFIKAHLMVQGFWYKGSIRDISEGGAYILSSQGRNFSSGDDILLVVKLRVLLDQIKGKIIWMRSSGIGVAFNRSEPDHIELRNRSADHCLFEKARMTYQRFKDTAKTRTF